MENAYTLKWKMHTQCVREDLWEENVYKGWKCTTQCSMGASLETHIAHLLQTMTKKSVCEQFPASLMQPYEHA